MSRWSTSGTHFKGWIKWIGWYCKFWRLAEWSTGLYLYRFLFRLDHSYKWHWKLRWLKYYSHSSDVFKFSHYIKKKMMIFLEIFKKNKLLIMSIVQIKWKIIKKNGKRIISEKIGSFYFIIFMHCIQKPKNAHYTLRDWKNLVRRNWRCCIMCVNECVRVSLHQTN